LAGELNPALNNDFTIHTSVDGEQIQFSWTKKNGYTCEVPTKIEFIDVVGVKKVARDNFAQFLLNAYPGKFELVGEVKEQLVVQPTVKLSEADILKAQLKESEAKQKELEAKIAEAKADVQVTAEVRRGRPRKQKEIVQ